MALPAPVPHQHILDPLLPGELNLSPVRLSTLRYRILHAKSFLHALSQAVPFYSYEVQPACTIFSAVSNFYEIFPPAHCPSAQLRNREGVSE